MSCVMRLTQNQNESISSILQHGHVTWKYCFALSTASIFEVVTFFLAKHLSSQAQYFHR